MEGSKISSVTSLLTDLKNSSEFDDESTVHIDEVIKCIQQLYNSYQQMKSDHEAATIDAGTMLRKFQRFYDGSQVEVGDARKTAKNENEELIKELRLEIDRINAESLACLQREKDLEKERKVLEEKTELVKETWPELSSKVSLTLEKKSAAKMKVNDTRWQTIDAHEKTAVLKEDTDELLADIEEYWKFCDFHMAKIKPEADICRNEIAVQKARIDIAKTTYEATDRKFRKARKACGIQEKITETSEAHAAAITAKRMKQDTIIGNKRTRFKAAVAELDMLQAKLESESAKYQEKVAVLENKLNVATTETEGEIEQKSRLTEQREERAAILESKKEQHREDIEKLKQKKTSLAEITALLDSASEELSLTNLEKDDLNGRIATILKYREITRSIYDRKISKFEEDLEREEECRKTELLQVKDMAEALHEERDDMTEFVMDGEKQLNLLIDQKAIWARTKRETSDNADIYTKKKEKLLHDEEITIRYNEIVAQELREEIAIIETNCDKSKAEIESLQKRYDEFEPVHRQISKKFWALKEAHTEVRNTIVEMNRTIKDKMHEQERLNKELKELDRIKDSIKNEIFRTNAKAAGYFKNTTPLKEANMEVWQEMIKHLKLHFENHKMMTACEETVEKVEDAERLIHATELNTARIKGTLLNKRNTLVDSVHFTMEQTDRARRRDTALIDDIKARKDFSEHRHSALEAVIGQMTDILTSMSDFQAGFKKVHKSSVCQGKSRKNS